jgi:hypothetical protein
MLIPPPFLFVHGRRLAFALFQRLKAATRECWADAIREVMRAWRIFFAVAVYAKSCFCGTLNELVAACASIISTLHTIVPCKVILAVAMRSEVLRRYESAEKQIFI